MNRLKFYLLAIVFAAFPFILNAQGGAGNSGGSAGNNPRFENLNPLGNNVKSLNDLLVIVLNSIIIPIGAVVIVIMIIYSGFLFVTARGNEDQLEVAKRNFLYVVIGAAILLGAVAISYAISGTICQLAPSLCPGGVIPGPRL